MKIENRTSCEQKKNQLRYITRLQLKKNLSAWFFCSMHMVVQRAERARIIKFALAFKKISTTLKTSRGKFPKLDVYVTCIFVVFY